ncbi:MAG: capsular polysaccharide biosynthesis protein, partial [Pseudomonadota bacterium]
MLELAGWRLHFGWPGRGPLAVWGRKPAARRVLALARLTGADVLTVEDGYLRSVHPGDSPLSLTLDPIGVHYDGARPSRLEELIREAPDDPARHARARAAMEMLRREGLSKYTPLPRQAGPEPGYVLVVDQVRGDASLTASGATPETFRRMAETARTENPGARVLIRGHPAGRGHLPGALAPQNPWPLIEGAARVYTVSSQLGFEALMAGRPVTCFG